MMHERQLAMAIIHQSIIPDEGVFPLIRFLMRELIKHLQSDPLPQDLQELSQVLAHQVTDHHAQGNQHRPQNQIQKYQLQCPTLQMDHDCIPQFSLKEDASSGV